MVLTWPGVLRADGRQDLQRDFMAQLRVGGLIDLSHPALADLGGYVIVAESGAGGQRHEL